MQYFGRCYELCTQLNDQEALNVARAQYDIARVHQHFQYYASTISTCPAENIGRLIAWEDDRVGVSEETEEKTDERCVVMMVIVMSVMVMSKCGQTQNHVQKM